MNKEEFINYCKDINIDIDKEMYKKLYFYFEMLKDWNNKFNLTTIIDEKGVFLKHFYDSLLLCKYVNLNSIKFLCDFGTGAGFPGLVLAIVYPNIDVTLIESNNKKCSFLLEVIENLKIKNVMVINQRVEIYAKKEREKYDLVTCRAVANLKVLCEEAIPLLKVGGIFCPLKGKIDEEIISSKGILEELSSAIENIYKYKLPFENSDRSIVIIRKKEKTKDIYPREYNKIIK